MICMAFDQKEQHLYFGDYNGLIRGVSLASDKLQGDMLEYTQKACIALRIDHKHNYIAVLYEDWSLFI